MSDCINDYIHVDVALPSGIVSAEIVIESDYTGQIVYKAYISSSSDRDTAKRILVEFPPHLEGSAGVLRIKHKYLDANVYVVNFSSTCYVNASAFLSCDIIEAKYGSPGSIGLIEPCSKARVFRHQYCMDMLERGNWTLLYSLGLD